jgi:flagellar hook protein FlgE
MLRALFAGVSGLRNHQTRLDVIGNNIANVNTVAFKASRVTFEEAYAQLLRGASRPSGTQGGVNPVQIGLGMNVGSVDQNFAQGNLEATGFATDLAIQGDAFFISSDGDSRFYTRAGNFQLDANGRLVVPTNGYAVQGVMADTNGVLPTGTALEDLVLPLGQKSPARATREVTLQGNLDSRAEPLGTILRTANRVYAIEQSASNGGAGSDVNGLFANGLANNQVLGMSANRTTVTITDGTSTQTYTYVANDTGVGDRAFNSLNDLIGEVNNDFATMTAAMDDASGEIVFTAGGAPVTLSITSSNSTLQAAMSSANGALAAAATSRTDEFSHVALASDLLTNLRNSQGASLGVGAGDTILIDGDVGGAAAPQGSVAVNAASTYQDLLTNIDASFGITNTAGSEVDASNGALQITGDGGTAYALSGLNIRVQGGGSPTFDGVFNAAPGNYVEVQEASDVEHSVAIRVFDSLGNEHTLSLQLIKDPTSANRWTWTAAVEDPAIITSGDSGFVTFTDDGRLETFVFNGGVASFQFDPNNGATAPMDVQVDAGLAGDLNGLSQFASPSNAVASGQDGFAMGNLQEFTIDELGVVTGFFTNGESQTLARIAVAGFANPTGLLRRGDNMYEESGNSGEPVVGFVGTTNQSQLTPGAIESSNVDLSHEFTDMIIAQRGFQANARVITTADEMLTELVNLKR